MTSVHGEMVAANEKFTPLMLRSAFLFLAGGLLASPALAQSQTAPMPALSYAPAAQSAADSWEARFGPGAANPGGRESGLVNLGGELITPRAVALNDRFAAAFVPRFHLGASANFNGTRYAYAGATWTVDLTQSVFVEASLGAAVNDGKTGVFVPENRLNVGCGAGPRGAAALGFRLSDRWSLVATMEHFGTAGCSERGNAKGPSNIGARIGYSF